MICRTKDGRVQVDPAMIGALEGGALIDDRVGGKQILSATIHLCNGTKLIVTDTELDQIALQWADWDRDQDDDDDDDDDEGQDFSRPIELTENPPIILNQGGRRRRRRS